jgi:hypothetical protein
VETEDVGLRQQFRNWEDKTESRPELCRATTGDSLPPQLAPYCNAFIALLEYRAQLSEIPANRVNRSWFDPYCQLSIDSASSLSPKRLPEAQFRANCLLFFIV